MGTPLRIAATVAGALLFSGCATPKDFDTGTTIRAMSASATNLAVSTTVSFVTTRCKVDPAIGAPGTLEELISKRCWEAARGNEEVMRLGFGLADSGAFTCGTATVEVMPPDAGDEAATIVDTPVPHDCGDDFAVLRQLILKTACRCALVFVHGYNTTFAFAVKRMAQLAHDLSYEGVPILFSFAAAGRLGDYVNDTEAAELAAPALHRLLFALSRGEAKPVAAVDVIAHSMGSRLALGAIGQGEAPAVRYLILAAPDIDPTAFLHLAKKAIPRSKRLTVYTSKFDIAMSASAVTHSGHSRVGEGVRDDFARDLAGAEFIDATERATDQYAHSYFAESQVMVDDIRGVLGGAPAAERKRLVCAPANERNATACKMTCPEGADCGSSFYARTLHWLFD